MDLETLLNTMTLEELASVLSGASLWTTVPVERLGIPAIKVTDGPNGARGGGGLVGGVKAACFPVAIALAATWNAALVKQIGQALAEEAKSKGARVLLAPTVNLHRSPLNGRNFECYSEDPYLTAQLAVAYIQGVQSQGIAATIKHYVGNDSEFERMTISSEIDERPLRELYLLPFEAAVKEARVWAVMSSYNKVNGTSASEHPRLLTAILKQEWGFDGVVMSDWFGTYSTAEASNAGLDLEMPGPTKHRGEKLVKAVRDGAVSSDTLRESARRLLRLYSRVGAFADPVIPEERAIDRPEHRAIIRQAGAEGIVLLKNSGLLPINPFAFASFDYAQASPLRLRPEAQPEGAQARRDRQDRPKAPGKIAVIGPNAKTAQIMGGGSAQVNAHYSVSPFDGLAAHRVELGYELGCTNYRLIPLLQAEVSVTYYNSPDLSGAAVASANLAEAGLLWFGEVAPGVDPRNFSARLAARFTPTEGGEYHFGLVSAGRSRLLVNGRLLIDNWQSWQPGQNYFGQASDEQLARLTLQAGQGYDLVVEYSSQVEGSLGIKGVRLGVIKPLGDEALERAVQLAATADVAVLCVGASGEWDTEGQDRPHLDLPGRQDELIARVAAVNPRTVVVLQTGGPVAMPWLAQVAAVLQAWYPGQECGNAIADVLFGLVNPAGRLPQTFPVRLEDNPAFINYPGENGRVRYGEGLFIGYRYYDKKRLSPLFPFGHGLSYTTFSYHNLRLSVAAIAPGESLTVTLELTNTGQRAGQEVVQLYLRDPQAKLMRPAKELKGFAKVELQPGETATVTLPLEMRALAYFDDAKAAWVAEAGEFEVLVGASAQDIRARARFTLTADWLEPVGRQS